MPANPRNKRPMGYAFVDVGTPENAEQAVKDFQGKELRDKPINVQIARPEGERKVRKPKKRTKKPAGEDATAENGATGEATANGDTEGDKAKKPNKRRQNRRRKSSVGAVEDGAQQNITPAPRPKASRGDGVPSTDTLFVANLPVEFNNDQVRLFHFLSANISVDGAVCGIQSYVSQGGASKHAKSNDPKTC